MDRIARIRQEEKKYHEYCYDNYALFEEGSWLYKPVKAVIETTTLLQTQRDIHILDLGCGVGRNSIPLAKQIKEKGGSIVCVDLLESALAKLLQYSQEYQVAECVQTILADISEYEIPQAEYDYIVAVSSLEHAQSFESLQKVLHSMQVGTKPHGLNCLVINTNLIEIEQVTQRSLEVLMEVNLSTDDMLQLLHDVYSGWELIQVNVRPQQSDIMRDEVPVILKSNVVTYVVRKRE
ncbi:class I SAM-dependent methyltransferase [Paenibacillus sp. RC67]|uniref:class I SAM-dependent methyltransferase n=1 Tax=Paenibacillus sp. RC67 TaxID=3039392 RepID=UPI0024AE6603|nr:class I SAM-dependent methyltransferase [Paenibacillus sp. RC67]